MLIKNVICKAKQSVNRTAADTTNLTRKELKEVEYSYIKKCPLTIRPEVECADKSKEARLDELPCFCSLVAEVARWVEFRGLVLSARPHIPFPAALP